MWKFKLTITVDDSFTLVPIFQKLFKKCVDPFRHWGVVDFEILHPVNHFVQGFRYFRTSPSTKEEIYYDKKVYQLVTREQKEVSRLTSMAFNPINVEELRLFTRYWRVSIWPNVIRVATRYRQRVANFRWNIEAENAEADMDVIAYPELIPGQRVRGGQALYLLLILGFRCDSTQPLQSCLRSTGAV